MKLQTILVVAVTALSSSAATLLLTSILGPPPAVAQQASAGQEGMTLYAYHRRDTEKNQGFIFYNSRTGDIWVYDDQNAKEHYRVTQMGQNLEKLQ